MKSLEVGVIGAGTAGLATAAILARQGHQVTVLEKAPALTPVGAGLLIQPSGMAVFQHLGVLPHAQALGAPIDVLQGWLKSQPRAGGGMRDDLLINSRYTEAAPDRVGLGMHRAALCDVLMAAVTRHQAEVVYGAEVSAVVDHGDQVQVEMRVHAQPSTRRFDLVLIANGARSSLRPQAWTRLDQAYPWGAAWAIVPEVTDLDYRVLHQFYHGTSRMMGLLPTGYASGSLDAPRLTSIFWSLPAERLESWLSSPDSAFQAWQDEVMQIWPRAGRWVCESGLRPEQFLAARYRDVVMSRFGSGRVGVIGDAAHAMSPQLGQGANMALLDAWAIGRASRMADMASFWQTYHQLRLPSIRFYQFMSRLLTPFYQSDISGLAQMRNLSFRWMAYLPWLRRQMAATISGVKCGPLQEISLAAIAAVD